MQTDQNHCPSCGEALESDEVGGLCPRCLMRRAMQPTAAAPEPPEAPDIDAVSAAFPDLEVIELVGRGGMGAVFKARQKSLERYVALKILPQSLAEDAEFAARFESEAKALAALAHSNIVTIHDFGSAGGFYFLLMEFVDGVNLRELLQSRKLSAEEALAIVPPLCEALQFAHDRGIVHRDIKPENLLLDKDGRVKIADFGIAKIVGETGSENERPAGTPAYMAPEQMEAPSEVDSRADIYSLGVVLYEMLTGEQPGAVLKPPSTKVSVDVRIDEIVLRALEAQPEMRWQTATDMRTQVEALDGSTRLSESDDWRITCLTCGNSRTYAEVGGKRVGASSVGKRVMVDCSGCGKLRRAIVHHANSRPLPPEEEAASGGSALGIWALICLLVGSLGGIFATRMGDSFMGVASLSLISVFVIGLILAVIWLTRIGRTPAARVGRAAAFTVGSLLMPILISIGVLCLLYPQTKIRNAERVAAVELHHQKLEKLQSALNSANARVKEATPENREQLELEAEQAGKVLRDAALNGLQRYDGAPDGMRWVMMLGVAFLGMPLAILGLIFGWRHLGALRRGDVAGGFGAGLFAALFWPLIIVVACIIPATIAILDDVSTKEARVWIGIVLAVWICFEIIRATVRWASGEDGKSCAGSPRKRLLVVAVLLAAMTVSLLWLAKIEPEDRKLKGMERQAKQQSMREEMRLNRDRSDAQFKVQLAEREYKQGRLTLPELNATRESADQEIRKGEDQLLQIRFQLEQLEDSRSSLRIEIAAAIATGLALAAVGLFFVLRKS